MIFYTCKIYYTITMECSLLKVIGTIRGQGWRSLSLLHTRRTRPSFLSTSASCRLSNTPTETGDSVVVQQKKIEYIPLTKTHEDAAKKLLYNSFFVDEPMSNCLGFETPKDTIEFVEAIMPDAMKDGVTIAAICEGEVVGVRVSSILKKGYVDTFSLPKTAKLYPIMAMLAAVNEGVDVFEHYCVDKCMKLIVINVDEGFRGQRVAQNLVNESVKVAADLGIRCLVTEPTSYRTHALYEKLKFDVLNEVDYRTFEVDGVPWFENIGEKDHSARLMGRKFESREELLNLCK